MKDREKRREERTASSDNPMTVSTWEGIGCSVWRADPAEHSRPSGSSNSIRASAVHPSNAKLEVLGIRSVPPECTVTPPTCVRRRASKESRIRDSRPASSSKCLNAARAAAPKPMIPGTFSVPDLKPYSLPPAEQQRRKKEPPLSCTDIQSPWGHGIVCGYGSIIHFHSMQIHGNFSGALHYIQMHGNSMLPGGGTQNRRILQCACLIIGPGKRNAGYAPCAHRLPIFPESLALPCPRGRHSRSPGPGPSSRRRHGPWTKRLSPLLPPAIWRKAILDASVPPEVNTISEGNAPNRAATAARASSTASRTCLAQP